MFDLSATCYTGTEPKRFISNGVLVPDILMFPMVLGKVPIIIYSICILMIYVIC